MDGLPTGTVTFLFTDIEGSTRRWQEDPAMSTALARHDAIVRKAVEAHGGHVLKHTGDGAIAVFGAAAEAVRAAVEAQRALHAEEWERQPLTVRMAVHTGEAEERDGDYFGPALNMAARLVDAGHGGQILVSLPTEELVRDRIPSGVSLRDLGEHRLRDLDHPERVFQATGEGLVDEFPPLAGTLTVPSNLPEPRTSFVGREDDVAQVAALLESRRLVTLIGVGGAGKTRLAVEVARRLATEGATEFRDGFYFCDLSPLTDGTAIVGAVAEALGMPMVGGPAGAAARGSREDDVAAFLRGRRILLLVDNCEHLLDDCADLADRLLAAAPGLVILATSREALSVEGEQSWQVRSLSLPDDDTGDDAEAMRLLVDRIRAVEPGFEVGPDNREALGEICVRLDGIPLALELAAARAAHLAPPEIAQRLGDRFKLLAGGRRRAQRQQTLQATVDWSYDLLETEEQAMLRRLAVFSGGFSLEAVEGVCMEGIARPAFDLLGSLVDKSLVLADTVEGQARYRLLETIRLYAEEKLAHAGEAERTRRAHRDWFLRRLEAEPWDRCLLSESLAEQLNHDYDNFRAALEWSEAEGRVDLVRALLLRTATLIYRYGRFEEAQRWLDRVLEYEETLARSDWFAHVLAEWLITWRFTGDASAAEASLTRLDALAPEFPRNDPAAALASMAQAAILTVFPKRAVEMERVADLAAEHAGATYPLMRVWSLWIKAVAYLYQRRYREAGRFLEELRASPERSLDFGLSYADSSLALVRHLEGDREEAQHLLEGDAPWTFQADHVFRESMTAVAAAAAGDLPRARRRMRDMVTSIRQGGWEHPLARSDCLVGLAVLAGLEGEWERASRMLAGVPGMATGMPVLWVLLRHYRDLARENLDPETRRRCIEEGRATAVDDLIDEELARWDAGSTA